MEKKRNICLINDSFPPVIDGVSNAVCNYAENIYKNYGIPTVATPYYPDADDAKYPFDIVRFPSIDTTKQAGYRTGVPFSVEAMNRLEARHFDLIHSHCPIISTMVARELRDRINVPVVMTYHTKFDIDIANIMSSRLLQKEAINALVRNINGCDEIWAVSRGAGDNLHNLGYEGDVIVMPNGVDFPVGRVSEEEVQNACSGYDLPSDLPMYLFVGRMMWYKGIRIILDACKKLSDAGQNFRMVFIGGGGDKEEIVSYAKELRLEEKVLFLDPIYDRTVIRAWYCRANLFLFPSTFDTNGLVVHEAAACALGSVLVKGSCAAEDTAADVNALLIQENEDSLFATLAALGGNLTRMKEIGENAQRDLYLSWEDSVKNATERYEIVIDNYRMGKYPKHEQFSDDFFHTTAEAMDFLIRLEHNRSRALASFNEGMEDAKESVKQTLSGFQTAVSDFSSQFSKDEQIVSDFLEAFYGNERDR